MSATMNPNIMNSMLNTNIIGMMSMRNDVNIYQIIFGVVLMNLLGFLPMLQTMFSTFIKKKFLQTKKTLENNMNLHENGAKKEIKASIQFIKNTKNKENDIIFNSINYHITNMNDSKFLNYTNDFSVVNQEPFEISEQIYCKVKNENILDADENENNSYIITIFSYMLSLTDLKLFIDTVKEKYIHEQKNKLGMRKYYFDEKIVSLPVDQEGMLRFDMAPKHLTFTMTAFRTNKSLINVFGDHLTDIKDRVHMFLHNKEWYVKKGIPYTLGIMLHGPPGTGKTSIIKAIAKDSNRHVFNIKFRKDTTQTQLRNLFYNEQINVVINGKNETFNIPISDRLYVIEDIDCLTDVLNKRKNDNGGVGNGGAGNGGVGNGVVGNGGVGNGGAGDVLSYADIAAETYADIAEADHSPITFGNFGMGTFSSNATIEESSTVNISGSGNGSSSGGGSSGNGSGGRINGIRGSNNTNNAITNHIISDIEHNKTPKKFKQDANKNPFEQCEALNLSFILNLMDGILETPGRILIITSNHPETLDPAFIRPGRIDVNVEVGYCNLDMIKEMFNYFYEKDCEALFKGFTLKKPITPAELNKIILNNYKDAERSFLCLCESQTI